MTIESIKAEALLQGWTDLLMLPNGKYALMYNNSPRKIGTLKAISSHIKKYPRLFTSN